MIYLKYDVSYSHFFSVGPNQSLRNFKLSTLSSTSVLASWRLPSAGSLHGITLLYKINNSEDPFTTIPLFNTSALNTSITGLKKFTEYEFHALVLTVNGYRPVSPLKVVRTSEDGKTIPQNTIVKLPHGVVLLNTVFDGFC